MNTKFKSLKAKRYTQQSSKPMHPCKNRVNYPYTSSYTFILAGNHSFFGTTDATVLTMVVQCQTQ